MSTPRPTPHDYNEFIGGLNLRSLRLGEAHIKFRRAIDPTRTFEAQHTELALYKQKSPGTLVVTHRYEVLILQPPQKTPAATIVCSFRLLYETKKPMTDDIWSVFSKTSLFLNTWPYMREFVHSALGRMNIPPIIAPTFRS